MMKRYSAPLKYSVNSNAHSNFKFKGKIKIIAVNYLCHVAQGNQGKYNTAIVAGSFLDSFAGIFAKTNKTFMAKKNCLYEVETSWSPLLDISTLTGATEIEKKSVFVKIKIFFCFFQNFG